MHSSQPLWGEKRRYDLSDLSWHTITEGRYYISLHSSPEKGQVVQIYKGKVSKEGRPLTEDSITEFLFAELANPVIFDKVIELQGIVKQPPEAQRYVDVRRLRGYTGSGR